MNYASNSPRSVVGVGANLVNARIASHRSDIDADKQRSMALMLVEPTKSAGEAEGANIEAAMTLTLLEAMVTSLISLRQ